jgi:hypothetical protein
MYQVHVFSAAGEAFAEPSKPFTYYVQDSPKSVQIHEVDWRQASQPVWRFVLPDSVKETVYSITPLSQGECSSLPSSLPTRLRAHRIHWQSQGGPLDALQVPGSAHDAHHDP